MQLARPAIGLDPRLFGRGRAREFASRSEARYISDDLRLFATTFLAGFVFVSLLIA